MRQDDRGGWIKERVMRMGKVRHRAGGESRVRYSGHNETRELREGRV